MLQAKTLKIYIYYAYIFLAGCKNSKPMNAFTVLKYQKNFVDNNIINLKDSFINVS